MKAGQKITKDTRLGLYGNTGASTGDHLHIEIDTDTKYPNYYHLEKIYVKAGQKITKDTRLGLYGNTGASTGDHLHIEIDTDTKYPNYTPQIGKNSGVLKSGTDSTINPTLALYVKSTAPDYQSVKNSGYDTVASADLQFKNY